MEITTIKYKAQKETEWLDGLLVEGSQDNTIIDKNGNIVDKVWDFKRTVTLSARVFE